MRKINMKRPLIIVLLHLSLLFIIAGALVTFFCGKSGSVVLLPGEKLSGVFPFGITLESFEVKYYPDSERPSDYVSTVQIDEGEQIVISMNNIGKVDGWRLYQEDYNLEDGSSTLAYSHDPWGIALVYAGYLLLLFSLACSFRKESFTASRRETGLLILLGLFFAGSSVTLFYSYRFIPSGLAYSHSELVPVLRSPLLPVHVTSIVFSYMVFLAILIIGVAGLMVNTDKALKLKALSESLLMPGVFMIAFGIIVGSVWANISWGNYWSWDPKETWALITMLVYAVPLHSRFIPFLRKPKVFHIYCIFAFLSVLITYYGVNFFLGGMHSYA